MSSQFYPHNYDGLSGSSHNAIALRSNEWQLCKSVSYALWRCSEIKIDIRWSKNRFSAEPIVIHLQNLRMANHQKAFELLRQICDTVLMITKLSVNVQVSDIQLAELLLKQVVYAKNIHLEEIHFRRRYVGQRFSALAELIERHAKTLRIVGKIGLSEAVQAFDSRVHLDRCSLMNFDLIEDGLMESTALTDATKACIRRLSGLGATFRHLSFTTYSGFQISRNPMLYFLNAGCVESLRLTMQKGVPIPSPALTRPLIRGLHRLELVGQMDRDPTANLELLFPDLEHFDFHYTDLVTSTSQSSSAGGVNERIRTVSEAISEADAEQLFVPGDILSNPDPIDLTATAPMAVY